VLTAVRGVPGILHNGTSNLRENMRLLHEESVVSPYRRTAGAYGRPGRSGHSAQRHLQPPGEHALSARRKCRFALPADGGCLRSSGAFRAFRTMAPPTSGRTCDFCTKKVSFRPPGGRRVLFSDLEPAYESLASASALRGPSQSRPPWRRCDSPGHPAPPSPAVSRFRSHAGQRIFEDHPLSAVISPSQGIPLVRPTRFSPV